MKLLIYFQISTVQLLKIGNGQVNSLLGMWLYLFMLGLKLIHVSKRAPDDNARSQGMNNHGIDYAREVLNFHEERF